jgi:hypothetical protein
MLSLLGIMPIRYKRVYFQPFLCRPIDNPTSPSAEDFSVTFEHDQVRNVVAAVDHGPIDEVLAILDQHLLQEIRVGDVDDGVGAAVPAQDLPALPNRLSKLKINHFFKSLTG